MIRKAAGIVRQPTHLRKSGISSVGEVPWGTHFCHFYQTKQDLLDILIPYFNTGLENNEFCLCVVYPPLHETEPREELIRAFPAVAEHFLRGDIEIVPYSEWYLKDGALDLGRAVEALSEKLVKALTNGYDGMRVNGNETWLTEHDWKNFTEYERRLNEVISNHKLIVLCTYPLADIKAAELFDVARAHQFAIAMRNGKWEILETPELRQTKEDLRQLSQQLEQRVAQRTAQLATANEDLNKTISEQQRTTELLRALSDNLRALSAKIQSARDEEGTRIAREIHDELGSALTTLKWETEGLLQVVSRGGDQSPFPAVQKNWRP